jgi:hypothetical protein
MAFFENILLSVVELLDIIEIDSHHHAMLYIAIWFFQLDPGKIIKERKKKRKKRKKRKKEGG